MTPEIKHRIEQIQRGGIPAGYHKTKLGLIPMDWKIKHVSECLKKVENPVQVEKDTLYTQIGIRSHGKGLFYKEPVTGEALGNKSVYWIEPDCFILNVVFAWERAIGKTTSKEVGMIGSHRFPLYLPVNNKVNVDYLVSYFLTKRGTEILQEASPGGAGRNRTLGQDRFMKSKIVVPPIKEQEKIVQILSTQNKIIALKEKRLAEKKRQKKYLMQQLFKGKYQENSKKVKLGDISSTFSGGTPDRTHPEYFGGGINWIKSGELNQKNIIRTEETITLEGLVNSSAKMVPRNTLLIAMYGATAGVMAVTKIDAAINQAVLAIIPQIKLNACYLKYAIEIQIDSAVNRLTQGGQPNFNAKIIKSFMIALPQLENQNVIAEILSTADREIELLERDLEQEKQKKKALMQLLLTGIVRISM